MPIGKERLVTAKLGNFLPLPGKVVFYVPKACFYSSLLGTGHEEGNDCIGCFQTVLFW